MPTLDSCSFHHLQSTMKTDTAAPMANWMIMTLRLATASNLGPVNAQQQQQRSHKALQTVPHLAAASNRRPAHMYCCPV